MHRGGNDDVCCPAGRERDREESVCAFVFMCAAHLNVPVSALVFVSV